MKKNNSGDFVPGIIGAGSFGTALAVNFAKYTDKVYLKCRNPEFAKKLKQYRQNFDYLPGIVLEENIIIEDTFEPVFNNANIIFLVVPSLALKSTLEEIRRHDAQFDFSKHIFINTAKGVGLNTLEMPHEVFSDIFGKKMLERYAMLSGPSFAAEVAAGFPTAVCIASSNDLLLADIKNFFRNNQNFRIYTLNDVKGLELGGALKNIIALASGISDGLKLGYNARAALITRGIVEITRFGEAMGADRQTFAGLSGLGDLILTSTSDLSRNRAVGLKIAQGMSLESITHGMKMIAEGVTTTKSVHILAKQKNIYMPITEIVYLVLYEGLKPNDAIKMLLKRDIKNEFD
jgi:glycerol-3-phosphate dehydrogenase (NAD(P)+)